MFLSSDIQSGNICEQLLVVNLQGAASLWLSCCLDNFFFVCSDLLLLEQRLFGLLGKTEDHYVFLKPQCYSNLVQDKKGI